jgi:hypothetical protein
LQNLAARSSADREHPSVTGPGASVIWVEPQRHSTPEARTAGASRTFGTGFGVARSGSMTRITTAVTGWIDRQLPPDA